MRREKGVCILSKEEMETSGFQGILIHNVNPELNRLYVKESFWKNGKFKEKKLPKIELLKGAGMEKLKETVYGEYNSQKKFDTFIMPEIFVEENVAEFIN